MPRRMQHAAFKPSDRQAVALFQQAIELAAITCEARLGGEDIGKDVLHFAYARPDRQLAIQLAFQVGGRRQVVGVDVGFEDPLDIQPLFFDIGDDLIGRGRVGVTRGIVEIQHAIDDGGLVRHRVFDDVGHGKGGLVEKCFNFRRHNESLLSGFHVTYAIFVICFKMHPRELTWVNVTKS